MPDVLPGVDGTAASGPDNHLSTVIDTVAEIAQANLDLDAVMTLITARTQLLTRADGAAVELAEGDEMVYRAATGTTEPFLGLRLKIATSLSGKCVLSGEVLCCDDSERDPRVDREACRRVGVRSMVVVPLHHDGRVVGVLKVMSEHPSRFTAADVQTLRLMAGLMGSAMARAELISALNEEIRQRRVAQAEAEEARLEAEAASRAKSDFLASMSHEIRTPMNAIIGMGELLADTPLGDEQREYVRILGRAGTSLLELINDILDLSKIESGHLELERVDFDLRELAESTAEVLAVRAHSKGLELACHMAPEVPQYVCGDPTRVRQVLINLVGNAIKFTASGEVVIRVQQEPGVPDALRFSVQDTGIGIPDDKCASIFESFTQVDASTTRRYGGTGLGLTICRRLTDLMGGRIWVESKLGAGSTFLFTVPLPGSPPVAHAESPATLDLRRMTALVVDDNATNRLILRETLAGWGAAVVDAIDGKTALALAEARAQSGQWFDLILLDCRMPAMDGFELAEGLKRLNPASDATVMMLTSDNRTGDIGRARTMGMGAYLVKPFKRSDLFLAVQRALGRSRAAAQAVTQAGAAPGSAAMLRILLVEDSEDNRLLVRTYLKGTPYTVEIAENGQIAVNKYTRGQYDLVLMDMQMPVMDGATATRAIRAWEGERQTRAVPIIALTANAMKEDVQYSLDAGCNAHVAKPIKKAILLAEIERHTAAGASPPTDPPSTR